MRGCRVDLSSQGLRCAAPGRPPPAGGAGACRGVNESGAPNSNQPDAQKCSGALVFRQVVVGTDRRGRRQWADDTLLCTRGRPLTPSSHRERHHRSQPGGVTAALWILVAVGLVVGAAILAWWWDRLVVAGLAGHALQLASPRNPVRWPGVSVLCLGG